MFAFARKKTEMPTADQALPGRSEPLPVENRHFVNGEPIKPPFPDGTQLALFGAAGFAFLPWIGPLGLLAVAVVIGTALGTRALDRVDELWFTRLYRTVLTVIALRLVLRELAAGLA